MGVFSRNNRQEAEEPQWEETCERCKEQQATVKEDLTAFQETIEQANQAKAEHVAMDIWGFAFKAAIAVIAAASIYQIADRYG